MLLGAHYAGVAIEASMLGATHACANPLSARYGTDHGAAIAVMLPHVVRWNAESAGARYAELLRLDGVAGGAEPLADRLQQLSLEAGLPQRLSALGVAPEHVPELARDAADQWTGRFNPRPFDAEGALELYRCAY
jgi:alcohol dehydrogenase